MGEKPPASRLGRTVQLARLATGTGARLALGMAKRAAQGAPGEEEEAGPPSEQNLEDHRKAAQHAVKILGNMKGLAMKAGQILSYVDDWMPDDVRPAYQEVLSTLQAKAPIVPLAEMLNVFVDEVGEPPDEVFRSFDDEPLASASIGQVYRAELPDGTPVAVKIQYPGIAEVIASDLKNLGLLESVVRRSTMGKLDVSQSLRDIQSKIDEELDYVREATSQERFAELYADDDRIVIPRVYREFSTRRVLTTELLEGQSYYEFRDTAAQEEIDATAEVLYEFVFGTFHRHGLFNADPHPGNYIFLGGGRVGFLDFGCVQDFPIDVPRGFGELVEAWWAGDTARVREEMPRALGYPSDREVPEDAKDFMFDYVTYLWRPVLEDAPFRYDEEYTREVYARTAGGAKIGARITWSEGYPDTEHRGLAMLNRLQFGFASILAGLRAEANWHRLLKSFLVHSGEASSADDSAASESGSGSEQGDA